MYSHNLTYVPQKEAQLFCDCPSEFGIRAKRFNLISKMNIYSIKVLTEGLTPVSIFCVFCFGHKQKIISWIESAMMANLDLARTNLIG